MAASGSESRRMVRILVADDQQAARQGLEALLETCEDFEVIGGAADGCQAVAMAGALCPNLVLMDCRMPRMDGLEATRIIKRDQPKTAVVALSMYPELESDARAAGADAFLVKGCPGEEVVREIRRVDERLRRCAFV